MSVVIETTIGDLTVDLFITERPRCSTNFLKLCKVKYYNMCLIHTVQPHFIAQTGDPTGTGRGGESIYSRIYGDQAKYFGVEDEPIIRHSSTGMISMVNDGDDMHGSQFFITLGEKLTSLDGKHTVFGQVVEGYDVLEKLSDTIVDDDGKPYKDIRITHTVILDDPFPDPKGLEIPSASPIPTREQMESGRIRVDEEVTTSEDENEEKAEKIKDKEAKAQATILEMIGDLPDADVAPPENVLFVCKLNPVTTEEDLELIFARFGKIVSCEIIRDSRTGDSLQYAFIEFDSPEACERAYHKMDNVLIDDRRIHVDFSQSVAKIRWRGRGRFEYADKGKNMKLDDLMKGGIGATGRQASDVRGGGDYGRRGGGGRDMSNGRGTPPARGGGGGGDRGSPPGGGGRGFGGGGGGKRGGGGDGWRDRGGRDHVGRTSESRDRSRSKERPRNARPQRGNSPSPSPPFHGGGGGGGGRFGFGGRGRGGRFGEYRRSRSRSPVNQRRGGMRGGGFFSGRRPDGFDRGPNWRDRPHFREGDRFRGGGAFRGRRSRSGSPPGRGRFRGGPPFMRGNHRRLMDRDLPSERALDEDTLRREIEQQEAIRLELQREREQLEREKRQTAQIERELLQARREEEQRRRQELERSRRDDDPEYPRYTRYYDQVQEDGSAYGHARSGSGRAYAYADGAAEGAVEEAAEEEDAEEEEESESEEERRRRSRGKKKKKERKRVRSEEVDEILVSGNMIANTLLASGQSAVVIHLDTSARDAAGGPAENAAGEGAAPRRNTTPAVRMTAVRDKGDSDDSDSSDESSSGSESGSEQESSGGESGSADSSAEEAGSSGGEEEGSKHRRKKSSFVKCIVTMLQGAVQMCHVNRGSAILRLGGGRPRFQVLRIPRRYGSQHEPQVRNLPTLRAMKYFDETYPLLFPGAEWRSIRLGLLSPSKPSALLNVFADTKQLEEDLQSQCCFDLQELVKKYREYERKEEVDVVVNEALEEDRKAEIEYQEAMRKRMQELEQGEKASSAEPTAVEKQEVFLDNYELSTRVIPSSIGFSSPLLSEMVPVSELKSLDEDDVISVDQEANPLLDYDASFPVQRKYLPNFRVSPSLHARFFLRGDVSRFPEPTRDPKTHRFTHYCLDGASLLPVVALELDPGDEVLDLCAAPGGKSLVILQTLMPSLLVCNDTSSGRLVRLRQVMENYVPKLPNIKVEVTQWDPREGPDDRFKGRFFDKILVDAPCSSDRHVLKDDENNLFKMRRTEERRSLPGIQTEILSAALEMLRPGGSLVYSTCTLNPTENDGVVYQALRNMWLHSKDTYTVRDLSVALFPFNSLFKLRQSRMKLGHMVLPFLPNNYGPLFLSRIDKNRRTTTVPSTE
ncbi:unnamed protein product [Cyprideis torosa]|uniref:peptidylprolyl isomerase n=1 Tax=Cyprideis torosa TaxID=163714 RepID=A0A7R8ZGL7_9CRUS|nr:unnamed protein product [Cyprideis torosa]CAG0880361.1 unnamed protein product [Cyprideis torosa]